MPDLDSILAHAKALKIDECEVVLAKRKITTIRITDSEIAEIKQNQEENLGLRLIHEKKISTAQASLVQGIEILDKAHQMTTFLKPREFWKSLPSNVDASRIEGTYDANLENIDGKKAADIAQEMINSASKEKITAISGSLNIVSEQFSLANSNGLGFDDKATYLSGMINADSDIDGELVSGIGQQSCRTLDEFSPEKVGFDASEMCLGSINARGCLPEEYSIIFEPYSVGELLSFVFTSNFNQKTYSEKKSCFSDKIGDKVAVDEFSLIDDPHVSQGIGSKSVDDEGIKTKINPLIENGIFKNTYSDLFDAFKEEKESTGNGLRIGSPMGRDAEPIPVAAPHNLRVKSGDMSQEEMIKETKHGILVGRLWYTYAVNPIKGDFSCTARSGIRIIENGEIVSPGKPVRIVHNLSVLLENISGIANNEKNVLQWASLPSITPSIRAEGIRVNPI